MYIASHYSDSKIRLMLFDTLIGYGCLLSAAFCLNPGCVPATIMRMTCGVPCTACSYTGDKGTLERRRMSFFVNKSGQSGDVSKKQVQSDGVRCSPRHAVDNKSGLHMRDVLFTI